MRQRVKDSQRSALADSKNGQGASRDFSPHLYQGRVRAVITAVIIGIVLAVTKSQKSRKNALPETYAICSRDSETPPIYTVDESSPNVHCFVVSRGNIVDRGPLESIRRVWGDKDILGPSTSTVNSLAPKSGTKIFYLKEGEAVYPGFADAHAHVMQYGQYMQLPLAGSLSAEEAVNRTKAYVLSHKDVYEDRNRWIEGQGWDQNHWPGQLYPTASDLEVEELQGRPIVLYRVDVHAMWVSSKVLGLLGPLPDTVEGGVIVRDESGAPTGVLVDSAMLLVEAIKPHMSHKQMQTYYKTTIKDAVYFGLTSIHDAATFPFMIDFYKLMAQQNHLPIRLYLMAHLDDELYWGDQVSKFEHPSDKLSVRSVKLFTDGALGSFGAALLEPYSDRASTNGTMIYSDDSITILVQKFVQNGWQTNVHCIGDRANKVVIDAFEELANASPETFEAGRHRIEHAQILTLNDIQRMANLNLIASMQPTHGTSDMGYAEQRLGPERIKGAYAWQSLIRAGARLALGSDAPVESLNPLLGFYAAISRLWPDGTSPHGPNGWYPEETLSRAQALKGMTLDAAYAAFTEDRLGSLEIGKKADFVITDRDIMTVPIGDILGTKVKATVVDGQLVYGNV